MNKDQEFGTSTQAISITDQKVLVIDNKQPIDKNRLIGEVKQWLTQFQTTQWFYFVYLSQIFYWFDVSSSI